MKRPQSVPGSRIGQSRVSRESMAATQAAWQHARLVGRQMGLDGGVRGECTITVADNLPHTYRRHEIRHCRHGFRRCRRFRRRLDYRGHAEYRAGDESERVRIDARSMICLPAPPVLALISAHYDISGDEQ